MPFRVIFAPTAIRDLAESVSYVSRFDREAAIRIGESLVAEAASQLSSQPRIGPVCPEYPGSEIRYWLHGNYRIVYEVRENESRIDVLRFWHCARGDWPVPLDG